MSSIKLSFCADVHIGNHARFGGASVAGINDRCSRILTALGQAAKSCCHSNYFFVLGDLFDTSKPSPQMLAETIRALILNTNSVRKDILVTGNHDQNTDAQGDNALVPLKYVPDINVIDQSNAFITDTSAGFKVTVLCVPFHSGRGDEWLAREVKKLSERLPAMLGNEVRILVTHLGVRDERTPLYLRSAHDSIALESLITLCSDFNISFVFTGNWHEHRIWTAPVGKNKSITIVQVGALVPTGFDNEGFDPYGRVVSLQVNANGECELSSTVIPGPRFVTVRSRDGLSLALKNAGESPLYVRWKCRDYDEQLMAGTVLHAAQDYGRLIGYSVELDTGDAKEVAREAGRSAAATEGFSEALAKFVQAMHLPPGVEASDVLARARNYLNRG